ncbi:expressed unknown protein [Seminavis robusta]|uniref:Uncharacterized protein n=1 Tax=Seminavis robusta TaxID=568900 RepID=A0A9N8DQZ6_9STRA|nr:expressed unknown protein [Seminavis robusta]|eukprot:Sro289_g109200.1 n/a (311) ;mRNA; r:66317-67249
MSRILLLLTVVLAVFLNTAAASRLKYRRRAGGGTRGEKGIKPINRRATHRSPRHLMGHYYAHDQFQHGYQPPVTSSKSKGKGGGSKGRKGTPPQNRPQMKSRPMCRPVVEGAEFIVEGAITMTMANMTEDSTVIGSEFIYNGPLLEFNDRDELTELENFFLSGSCMRTQERDDEMPGAGHCAFTVTLDTGATMNFGGEAFDGWDNLMAINGGSQELIGLSGTVTLIGLNDDFEDTSDDFFSVPWIYGEAVLVYSICPQGYWDRYYIDDHDALPPPSIPDPFQRNVQEQQQEILAVVVEPVDDDDDYGYDY